MCVVITDWHDRPLTWEGARPREQVCIVDIAKHVIGSAVGFANDGSRGRDHSHRWIWPLPKERRNVIEVFDGAKPLTVNPDERELVPTGRLF